VIFGSFANYCDFLSLLGFSVFFVLILFRFEFYSDSKFIEIQNMFKFFFCSHTNFVQRIFWN
jgi:hypothetical protein